MALLLGACGSPNPSTETSDGAIADFIYSVPHGSDICLYGIQDCQQVMPIDLFRGLDDKHLEELLPEGQAEASINVFLLKDGGHLVLFDAGMGADKGGGLKRALDTLCIASDQISDICITHLHFDHVGGLFNPDGSAAFPTATLHIPRPEFDAWESGLMGDGDIVSRLKQCYGGRIDLFTPGDTLLGNIVSIAAPGHTPGHTVYDLGDVLIVGDILHAVALQVEHPEFCARFDADPKQAVATRQAILDRARSEHISLAGMHFPIPTWISL